MKISDLEFGEVVRYRVRWSSGLEEWVDAVVVGKGETAVDHTPYAAVVTKAGGKAEHIMHVYDACREWMDSMVSVCKPSLVARQLAEADVYGQLESLRTENASLRRELGEWDEAMRAISILPSSPSTAEPVLSEEERAGLRAAALEKQERINAAVERPTLASDNEWDDCPFV